jgi:lipopolysaccharide exporter
MAGRRGTSVPGDELDTKIMRSSAWAVLGYGGTQALSLVTMLVLARVLVPEDFGVVALALALLAVAQVAQDSGLGAALIVYRGDLRRAAACVAVYAPLVALVLYTVFFIGAPLAARFFREPELTSVLRVMAVVLVFRGLSVMPRSLLERALRFGPVTTIELSAGLVQAGTAIGLAFAGAGVWSLVAGQLAFGFTTAAVAWVFAPIRPSPFEARRATLFELARYGRHVGVANLLNYAQANSAGIVVGRVVGATALGYYAIAERVASLPVNVIGNILGRGVFAAMARMYDEPERLKRIWLENVQRLALLSVPAAIGVALVAEPLVVTLLGDDWRPAIVPLQLLAVKGVIGTFAATSGEVFQALHRPQLRVVAEVTYLALLIPALIVGARADGIAGAAAATLIVNAVLGSALLLAMMRLLAVEGGALVHAVLPPAIGWALMTAAILVLRPLVDGLSPGVQLAILVAAGAAVYMLSVIAFARDLVTTMWVNLRGARTLG